MHHTYTYIKVRGQDKTLIHTHVLTYSHPCIPTSLPNYTLTYTQIRGLGNTYTYKYIHAHIHPYLPTHLTNRMYTHRYVDEVIHTYIHTCKHTSIPRYLPTDHSHTSFTYIQVRGRSNNRRAMGGHTRSAQYFQRLNRSTRLFLSVFHFKILIYYFSQCILRLAPPYLSLFSF